jgi:hypothetical protein
VAQLDDTTVVIGGDSIHLGRAGKNFFNADLTMTGPRNHSGGFYPLVFDHLDELTFRANTSDGLFNNELRLYDGLYLTNEDLVNGLNSSMMMQNDGLRLTNEDSFNGLNSSMYMLDNYFLIDMQTNTEGAARFNLQPNGSLNLSTSKTSGGYSSSIQSNVNGDDGTVDLSIGNSGGRFNLTNSGAKWTSGIKMYKGDSIKIAQGDELFYNSAIILTQDKIFLSSKELQLFNLPPSTNSTDSALVIDNNGQVKKGAPAGSRKSATVNASSYIVPADVDVVFVNYTGGTATITLPSGTLDREIIIKNLNTTNSVALSGLDASESNTIATRGAITVKYTGSAWVGISKY